MRLFAGDFLEHFPMKTIALWLEFRFNLFIWTRGEGYPNVNRSRSTICSHDDVIKWKHFPRYWSFVRGIHRSLVNSPHKGQWRGALMFSLICAWTNGWVNNRGAGDLRYHCCHCNVNSTPCSQALAKGLKMRNISRPWPNLNSSEGSQDISACQTSGHYCHAFSIKYGNHTFEMFHWVEMPPKIVICAHLTRAGWYTLHILIFAFYLIQRTSLLIMQCRHNIFWWHCFGDNKVIKNTHPNPLACLNLNYE